MLSDRPPVVPWRRVMARGIDAVTVLCTMWALTITQIFWFMDRLSDRFDPQPWGRAFVATIVFVILSAVYEVAFLVHSKGQTPGKDILKMRVVPAHATAAMDHLDVWQALVRWLPVGAMAIALTAHPVYAAAVAVVFGATLVRPRRQGAHDLLAGTLVVPYDREAEDPTARKRAKGWRRQRMLDRRHTGDRDYHDDTDD